MEPTIYKPSIYKGAGIYKAGAEGGGGGIQNKLTLKDIKSNIIDGYFVNSDPQPYNLAKTDSIDLEDIISAKFHFECEINYFHANGYSVGFGEFATETFNKVIFLSIYISSDNIRIAYSPNNNTTLNIDVPATYLIGDKIVFDIDVNSVLTIVKVYYKDDLVCYQTINNNNMLFENAVLNLGGLRVSNYSNYDLVGRFNLFKSYIEINDSLVWGVK